MNSFNRLQWTAAVLALLSAAGCAPGINSAARRGDVNGLRRMLDRGANVNTKDVMNFSQTPLHEAVANGHTETVKLLLERGANVHAGSGNLVASHGPPINWLRRRACDEKSKTIAKLLIEAGADVNVRDRGSSALEDWSKDPSPCAQEVAGILGNADRIQTAAAQRRQLQVQGKERDNQLKTILPEIREAEQAGDAEKQAGRNEQALAHYASAVRLAPRGTDEDIRLRQKVISHASSMTPKPSITQEADKRMIRGLAFLKMAENPQTLSKAMQEMEIAIADAPWWAEAYYNLGLVQEKLSLHKEAIANMQLYLFANPDAADSETVRRKIIELGVAQEMAETGN